MVIDVVIPYHSKDRNVLPWCIEGIRKHMSHNSIFVISDPVNERFVENLGVRYLNENAIVDGLSSQSFQGMRWSWYFQQLLKFGMAGLVNTDYYLAIDADTVLLRNVAFFNENDKPLYHLVPDRHLPYFEKISQLLGIHSQDDHSYIAHHMIFSKAIVKEMLEELRSHEKWYTNIMSGIDLSPDAPEKSMFSEYETYGHYLEIRHPEERDLRELKFSSIPVAPCRNLIHQLSRYYDYCSFHHYAIHAKPQSIRGWVARVILYSKYFLLCKFDIRMSLAFLGNA